jgi:hypothetical protein
MIVAFDGPYDLFRGKAPLDQLQEGADGGRRVISFRVKAQACTGAWKQIFVRIQQDLTRANLVPAHVLLACGGPRPITAWHGVQAIYRQSI